jgi:Na+-translocating ferredoxin:NAD+ oxidoreductase RnfG subunit
MKEYLRIALTLFLLLAVSTASLSFVHSITSEVIAERDAERDRDDIVAYFPTASSVEEKAIDGVHFKVAYDEGDVFLGVLAQATASGYMGAIPYQLAINHEGQIMNIQYGPNQETAGIGKKIEEEPFITQIIGLTPADPIELGRDIDAISGATESSAGMAQSLRDTLDKFAANFLDG